MTKNALIVVDMQQGFDDPRNGPRNNPACEENVQALLESWRSAGQPVVLVRHDSIKQGSPLAPGQSGNDLKSGIEGAHDLFIEAQNKGWMSENVDARAAAVFVQAYTVGRVVDDIAPDKVDPEAWINLIMDVVDKAILN